MKPEIQAALRKLPKVDEVVNAAEVAGLGPRWAVLAATRAAIDAQREALLAGQVSEPAEITPEVLRSQVERLVAPSLRPLINATGVVLHTNLGRAPLGERVLERIGAVAGGYSNLEYDVQQRRRGSRHGHLTELVRDLCGAEDAVVVNNNAAAVLLCLAAHARGREVVVSRGELVEIGGSFRIPEVMEVSGARLREVGTTNRTHPRDYEAAIGENTALLLKVHSSNYSVVGFTKEVTGPEMIAIGRARGVMTMYDLGSGTFFDLRGAVAGEQTVQQAVADGFDLVTFSGDKLLGGPQAGLIVGSAEAIAAVRAHPLTRAVRPDKMTIAGVQATLAAYRDGQAASEVPALRMLTATSETLRELAERLRDELTAAAAPPWAFVVVEVGSAVGGGAAPTSALPSWAVAISHPQQSADRIEARLRGGDPPVIARIEEDRLLLDVRTLLVCELSDVVAAISVTLGVRGA